MFKCAVCDVSANSVCHFRTHLATKKHILNVEKHKQSQLIVDSSANKVDNTQSDNAVDIKEVESKYVCKCCNKVLSSKFNLKRHLKTCDEVRELLNNKKEDFINELVNDVLNNKVDKSLLDGKQPINIVINNITNNNNTNNNNTNNTNNNVNVLQIQSPDDEYYQFWKERNINPVGFENLDMLSKTDIADRIHGSGLNAFMELIKVIYSNSQNHNVALYNKREKLVKYLNSNGEIEITTMQKMLDLLVQNNIDVLDKFLDDKDITIRKTYKSVIDKLKFIHEQDGDNPYFPKYVEALRLILLNISKSALEKIADFEQAITKDLNELEKMKNLTVPRTDLRLKPS
jgi:hypothetical protein